MPLEPGRLQVCWRDEPPSATARVRPSPTSMRPLAGQLRRRRLARCHHVHERCGNQRAGHPVRLTRCPRDACLPRAWIT